ncbi:hypothetical protein BX600DRAFT_493300 [Xylariales sp. PMI_506]|nr:hypothetical protein BX600DRAFT_493300 [Xylariales sp. PMI_506]
MPSSTHPRLARTRQGSPHPGAFNPDDLRSSPPPRPEAESSARGTSEDGEAGEYDFPELVSLGPAIFVPAQFDYTKPQPLLVKTTSARTAQQMDAFDAHTRAVKANMAWLFRRQAERFRVEAAKKETALLDAAAATLKKQQQHGQSHDTDYSLLTSTRTPSRASIPGLRSRRLPPTDAEEKALVRRLEATPTRAGGEASGAPETRHFEIDLGFEASRIPVLNPHPRETPREAATTEMLGLVRNASVTLAGYQAHITNVRRERREKVATQVAREVADELQREAAADTQPRQQEETRTGDDMDEGEPMDLS